jgi:translation initiation factor 2 subunit 1
VKVARENIVPSSAEINGVIELCHNGSDGIEHIKKALKALIETDSDSIGVQYLGAPKYLVTVKAKDYKTAEKIMEKGIKRCLSVIEDVGGRGEFKRMED